MQAVLFHENLNDALKEVVLTLGGTKRVGSMLWPEKSADEAGRRLADCLNPDRRDRLDPEQVLWLLREGRQTDCHSAMHFICASAGYAPAAPVKPEDELAALQREYIEAARVISRVAQRIEAMETRQ
ncbi:MAG: hypothetical protein LBI35_00835 [Burkholderiales bacterium]|jgi:hypothetical protein|nr:hypothetical protein [Burkholderiales bacterium]